MNTANEAWFHVLAVKTNGPTFQHAEVLLDGRPLKGVTAIDVEMGVDMFNTVRITMIADVELGIEVGNDNIIPHTTL